MSIKKDTNPKSAFGDAKAPLSIVPMPVVYEIALGLLEGAFKYGSHNYRVKGVRNSTYYNAAMRHLNAWWEGEDIDSESGLPHITKAMASLMVLRDAQMMGMVTDDRPPACPDGWQDDMAKHVAALREKFPDPVEPFTEKSDPRVS